MLSRSLHINVDYLPGFTMGLTAGVTGRQEMLTPPRHLIPPLVFPGVRVSLIFYSECFLLSDLDTDFDCRFSVLLTGRTVFDCR
jgi:hypothetical protein